MCCRHLSGKAACPDANGGSLCVTWQHVAVALNSGRLFFLRTDTGACSGACDAGGRTPPVADAWLGLIWNVSHSNELTLTRAPGDVAL